MFITILAVFGMTFFWGESFDAKVSYCMKEKIQNEYCADKLTQLEIKARTK